MDFSYWDLKDKFTLTEASLLWTEQSPDYIFGSLKVKGEAAKIFDVLLEAVEKKEISLDFDNTVAREELTVWAKRRCPQSNLPHPKFLFFEERKIQEEEERKITAEEATKVAQQSYDRTAEGTRKRNEFIGVVKTMLVVCPDRCKNKADEITTDSVYEAVRAIANQLWGEKKPILREQVAKLVIEKLLKEFIKR